MREARQHRDYNILSNAAPTRSAEASFCATRDAHQSAQRDRAVAKQLQTTLHNYNIVTMAMLGGASPDEVKGNQAPRGKLVSKDGNTFTSTARYALEPDAWVSPPVTPRTQQKDEARLARVEGRERCFNIVNQEYRVDHDVKAEADRLAERQRVNAAAMLTDSYNPLTCKYRHADDEAAARVAEAERSRQFRVAELVRTSDGGAYNILSNVDIDAQQAQRYDQRAARGVAPRAERRRIYETMRDGCDEKYDFDCARSLNRVNQQQRSAEALAHGYDILSNRPFATAVGQDAANPNSLKPLVALDGFRPNTTLDAIRREQQHHHQQMLSTFGASGGTTALAGNSSSTAAAPQSHPRTTHQRLFCHPTRAVADEEVRLGETARSAEFERQRLPSIGSGVVAKGWDPSPSAELRRTGAASALPAGGASNLLDKNEMGKSSLRRVNRSAPSYGGGDDKSVRSAGAAGNNAAKAQLKPLVSKNLMAASAGDSSLRSFF